MQHMPITYGIVRFCWKNDNSLSVLVGIAVLLDQRKFINTRIMLLKWFCNTVGKQYDFIARQRNGQSFFSAVCFCDVLLCHL